MTTFKLSADDDYRYCREEACDRTATLVTYPGQRFHCDDHGPEDAHDPVTTASADREAVRERRQLYGGRY